ncbi:CPBP family intramembrane glutamic endopeptidase [Fontibacillus sp. BL9]|uniref:CPBP family intramembrane glutamic endopeptidase n=1 Tax=Fontibacillus sp. BL9 TaxID=3389971 RepID=UPI003978B21D
MSTVGAVAFVVFIGFNLLCLKYKRLKKWAGPAAILVMLLIPSLWKHIARGSSLLMILIAILSGYFAFMGSLMLINRRVSKDEVLSIFQLAKMKGGWKTGSYFFMTVLSCLLEEFLWRGTIQSFLGNTWIAVLLTSVLFTISHIRRRFKYVQMLDIFCFSLLLGGIFAVYQDIWFVAVVHCSRNIGVICHQELMREAQKPQVTTQRMISREKAGH